MDSELEDDPGELVEIIVSPNSEMGDTTQAKKQLRDALAKLIDERVNAILQARAT